MPKLPPKWRRRFWRWHDRTLDAWETITGRVIALLVIAAVSYVFVTWAEGAEWDWPVSVFRAFWRPAYGTWQDSLPSLLIVLALVGFTFLMALPNQDLPAWAGPAYVALFVYVLAMMMTTLIGFRR